MKKIWMLSLGALITFSACEKEEELKEELTEKEHCDDCGPELDAYTDVHEIAVWFYEGTEDFEISLEEQWDENDQVHTYFHKTGGPSEAISVYYHDEEELMQFAGAGVSFGLTGTPLDLETVEPVDYNTEHLFFSNEAEVGDSWNSFNWGKEVVKTFVGFSTIEVPAGEFCCKKIEIVLGHGLVCYQWVSEIGLIAEEYYQDGGKEPVAEYYLTDIEERECEYEEKEEEYEEEEEQEENCEC
jgi:hypothetical protein